MKLSFHSLMFKTYQAQKKKIRKHMPEVGLSPGQPKILNFLLGHNQCMQKDIALNCDIEAATVSKILNVMEEHDLVTRTMDENNRRAGCIAITKKGKLAVEEWNIRCREVEMLALKDFNAQEKAEFESYLCRMYENLSEKKVE